MFSVVVVIAKMNNLFDIVFDTVRKKRLVLKLSGIVEKNIRGITNPAMCIVYDCDFTH